MSVDPDNFKFFADSVGKLGEAGIISYELLSDAVAEADRLNPNSYAFNSDIDEEVASSLRTGLRNGFSELRIAAQSISTYSTVIDRLNNYVNDI